MKRCPVCKNKMVVDLYYRMGADVPLWFCAGCAEFFVFIGGECLTTYKGEL